MVSNAKIISSVLAMVIYGMSAGGGLCLSKVFRPTLAGKGLSFVCSKDWD